MTERPAFEDVPRIGFGTWQLEGDACYEGVRTAIETGYRHIDTARMYGNEEQVGQAIADAPIGREDLFIATKLWYDDLSPSGVEENTKDSLKKLGLDTIDLLYIHWPTGDYSASSTLPALEKLKEDGLIREVGLSNFTPPLFSEALRILDDSPLALQVEMHPHLQQRELHELALENDLYFVAYSPLKRTEIFEDEVIKEIAEEVGAVPAQVCLAWHLSRDRVIPIPKSSTTQHIQQNFAALDLELSEVQIERINELDAGDRAIDPTFAPW